MKNLQNMFLKGFIVSILGFIIFIQTSCKGASSGNVDGDPMALNEITGAGTQSGSAVFDDTVFTNTETVDSPASIQTVIDSIPAGQKTKIIINGNFNQAVTINGKSYIWLCGGTGAVIDGTGLTLKPETDSGQTEYLVYIKNSSYIKVSGITVRNHKTSGSSSLTLAGIMIKGWGNNIEISGNTITGIENTSTDGNAHGLAVYGNSTTPISNIIIDNNMISNCKLGWSESMVLNGNVTDFTVSGNSAYSNDNIGIDFIGFEGTCPDSSLDQARNGICVDNQVYDISSISNPAYGGETSADGIYVDGGKNIIIERNKVDSCDIGIEMASEHSGKTTENITVRNNFISNSLQGNILMGGYDVSRGYARNILIMNNTTYNGNDGEVILQYYNTGVLIANNIFYAKSGNSYIQKAGTGNNSVYPSGNLYYNGESGSSGDWEDTGPLFTDPLFVNAASRDFHIQSGSSAKNAGDSSFTASYYGVIDIDGDSRVTGEVDMGADEVP